MKPITIKTIVMTTVDRRCNICKKKKKDSKFKHPGKKTCKRCEFRWKRSFLRLLVQDRRLSATKRLANIKSGSILRAFFMYSDCLGLS